MQYGSSDIPSGLHCLGLNLLIGFSYLASLQSGWLRGQYYSLFSKMHRATCASPKRQNIYKGGITVDILQSGCLPMAQFN